MKKYVLLVILICLTLTSIATATKVDEKMGPYEVTFNTNFTSPDQVKPVIVISTSETFEGEMR